MTGNTYTSYVRTGVLAVVAQTPGLHMTLIKEQLETLAGLETSKGALDAALKNLMNDGFLMAAPDVSDKGRAIKAYQITTEGMTQLEKELDICMWLLNSR